MNLAAIILFFTFFTHDTFSKTNQVLDIIAIHNTHLNILENRGNIQAYEKNILNIKFGNHQFSSPDLSNILFSKAYANDGYLYCNYGGWPVLTNEEGKCIAPWEARNRRSSEIKQLGPTYGPEYSCGAAKKFRCHPLVFYTPNDEKGLCVENVDDKNPKEVMKACIKAHEPYRDDLVNKLLLDQQALASYLVIAGEASNFCETSGSNFESCDKFISLLSDHLSKGLSCHHVLDIFPYLPSLVTPVNQTHIDRVGQGIANQFLEYMGRLELEQKKVEMYNKGVIKKYIDRYSKDEQTQSMIAEIKKNSTACLEGSCSGLSGITWEKRTPYKKPDKATGFCYRYVKHAIMGGEYHDDKIPGAVARNAGYQLKQIGFTNLMELDDFREINESNAPIGSIIVYKNGPRSSSDKGHIEVKLSEGKKYNYGSDHLSKVPISEKYDRIPIGIYVKLPKKISELKEIPKIGSGL